MKGKIIGAIVGLMLVVGVVVGAVVMVNKSNEVKKGSEMKTSNKAVTALCSGADDKQLCYDVLTPVNSTNPKDFIAAVIKSSAESVIKALNMSDQLSIQNGNNGTGTKMALDDCKDLLQSAIHELEATGLFIEGANITDILRRSSDLKNWFGAVIAYQQSCLDGFNTDGEKQIRTTLEADSMDSVMKITALALDVVTGISKVLGEFGFGLNQKIPARRLLFDLDSLGYPTWLSSADRKIVDAVSMDSLKPNAVVAKDGSGQFKTISDALNSYPKNHQGRYVIYVKAGTYDEYITVDKKKPNIFMYGDGPDKTIITGRKNFAEGVKTMRTATFSTVADGFIARNMAFENTAGAAGHQAVALRVQGDHSAFFDCAIRGYQDTLYAHAHRQFYRNCEISGTIDFIFGYASVLIQNSKIILRKPGPNQQNIVVADGTDQKNMPTGIVLQNCEIKPDASLMNDRLTVKSYLARPWKAFSRAVFIENEIGDVIQKEGYIPWSTEMPNTENAYFAEYGNRGLGSDASARAKFAKGVISKADASKFTAESFLQASTWLTATGFPYDATFTTTN